MLAILRILTVVTAPRVGYHRVTVNRAACYANKRDIERQVKLRKRSNSSYPAANLSDVGQTRPISRAVYPSAPWKMQPTQSIQLLDLLMGTPISGMAARLIRYEVGWHFDSRPTFD